MKKITLITAFLLILAIAFVCFYKANEQPFSEIDTSTVLTTNETVNAEADEEDNNAEAGSEWLPDDEEVQDEETIFPTNSNVGTSDSEGTAPIETSPIHKEPETEATTPSVPVGSGHGKTWGAGEV